MRVFGVALAVAIAVLTQTASAQSVVQKGPPGAPPSAGPPVAIGPGWRYEARPNDLHMFLCQQDSCNRSSRVSYRFYAPDMSVTLEKFRGEQQKVVSALEQRAPAGTRVAILSIEGGEGGLPRMYTAKRLMTSPDGAREFIISSIVLGEHASASLISSSRDEKAADANHALYAMAVMLRVSVAPKSQ